MYFHPEYTLSELKCNKCNHNDLGLLLVAHPGNIKFASGGLSAASSWGRQNVLNKRSCHQANTQTMSSSETLFYKHFCDTERSKALDLQQLIIFLLCKISILPCINIKYRMTINWTKYMVVPLQRKNETPQLPKQGRESFLMSVSKDTRGCKAKSGYCSSVRLQSCLQISRAKYCLHSSCYFLHYHLCKHDTEFTL